jgi:hypothetical protein
VRKREKNSEKDIEKERELNIKNYKSAGDTCKALVAFTSLCYKRACPTKNEPQQGISYLEREREEVRERGRGRERETGSGLDREGGGWISRSTARHIFNV